VDVRGLMVVAAVFAAAGQPPEGSRTVIVMSDLHMGIGRDASGAWDRHEDFRWAAEFTSFLKAIDHEGQSAVDLVMDGDTFDLLYGLDDCGAGNETGCSEAEAIRRLDRVLTAHAPEVAAINEFARTGANRVAFVPGDADAALLFPGVRRRLLAAMAAGADRVTLGGDGFWLSGDGRVLVEHGHQVGFSAHRFENWPLPFSRGTPGRLLSPWGEQLTSALYRRLEETFPIVDNVAVLGAGLKPALAAEPTAAAGTLDPLLLKYLMLTTVSWQQFRMELDDGDVEPPIWNIGAIRGQRGAFLVAGVPEDDPIRPLATRALADGTLDAVAQGLSDEEIVTACDYRAAIRRARRRFEPVVSQFPPRGPAVTECPRTAETRGALFDYFWRSRDAMFSRHIDETTRRLRRDARPAVFVHAHTHLPDRSQAGANMISGGLLKIPMEGFSPIRGQLTPLVINAGAWQRTVTPVQLDRLLTDRTLASLQPDDLPACYSFVEIPPYRDSPVPRVRYWRQQGDQWAAGASCR
jgi:UDP-2,3-diacylglucosamine pyrophosphatase LpxH